MQLINFTQSCENQGTDIKYSYYFLQGDIMVKTRFAPSPTGKLHVGNVRTALFAWLYARNQGGHFILRIEDTDQERSLPEYTDRLMEDLKWLGLDWDEGPEVGGPNGPYKQSERLDIYDKYIDQLVEEGRAYPCFCTQEELEAEKEAKKDSNEAPHYSGKCRHLSASEIQARKEAGTPYVIRFWAYDEDFSFKDIVKGEVTFPKGMVGDFVIRRSNGLPVYNFAVVLDDALMEVTHVMRADEHLSNTVRQLMIFRSLGFKEPVFVHMPLILGQDKQKLSKRHGATSVSDFKEEGYLPESLINYLALLGWSSPDGREVLPRKELIKLFDLKRINKSPAVFDPKKFEWIAKHDIINADSNLIYDLALPFIMQAGLIDEDYLSNEENEKFLRGVIELTRGYCSHLSQITEHLEYFLNDQFAYDEEAAKFLENEISKTVIKGFIDLVSKTEKNIDEQIFHDLSAKLQESTGAKGKNLFIPLRAALTGHTRGPEIYFLMPVIGNERTLARLQRALDWIDGKRS